MVVRGLRRPGHFDRERCYPGSRRSSVHRRCSGTIDGVDAIDPSSNRTGARANVTVSITRADLLRPRSPRRRGARRRGRRASARSPRRASADPLPAGDLAYARLLVGAELLASDFYQQAIAASNTSAAVTKYLKRAYLNEQEHYQSVAGILSGSRQHAGRLRRLRLQLPGRHVRRREASILKFAVAARGDGARHLPRRDRRDPDELVQDRASPRSPPARPSTAATSRRRPGGKAFNLSFPPALTIQQASDAFAAYTA